MYPITPLLPFWAYGSAGAYVTLPGWYLESYSMEDRFKQIAERQGVSEAWDMLALERLNLLSSLVNEQALLVESLNDRVTALEAANE